MPLTALRHAGLSPGCSCDNAPKRDVNSPYDSLQLATCGVHVVERVWQIPFQYALGTKPNQGGVVVGLSTHRGIQSGARQ